MTLNIPPVVPIALSLKLILITCWIFPVISQKAVNWFSLFTMRFALFALLSALPCPRSVALRAMACGD
jgi:hypothetical protein